MVSAKKNSGLSKRNKWIIGVVSVLVVLVGLVIIFGTPSAESVFKSMNAKMLKTESVTVNQTIAMKGSDGSTSSIKLNIFMNMKSSDELLASGDFSLNITNSSTPMSVSGDLLKIGDSNYVKFSEMASTDPTISSSFVPIESKLKSKWVKVRTDDQFASMANSALDFTSSIFPIPYANLNDTQIKELLSILQDKSTYTIDESSRVDMAGVPAYKYSLSYDKDQYKKVEKAISGYVSYFKQGDSSDGEISSLTAWVNISTNQIIKIEFEGTSASGDATGTIEFSDYNKTQTIDKPSDYFVESELLN